MGFSLNKAIYEDLTATAAVTDKIGTRLYPLTAPTSAALPYATFQLITATSQHHAKAASALRETLLQIDVWAADSVAVEDASIPIVNALDGRENFSMGATEALDVQSVTMEDGSPRFIFTPPSDGSEVGTFRVSMDFQVWHAQNVPTF